jgi:hypothetical protein
MTRNAIHCGHICVFAKPPRPGDVKTRLAPVVGIDGAAALARAFFQDTWAMIGALGWARAVLATTEEPGSSRETLDTLEIEAGAEVWLQGGGDLGRRIERVLRRALERGPCAIALGADSPGLPARALEQARDALGAADAVLGPCDDGGFYLLGLNRCPEGLLDGIPWSSDRTFERTLARLRQSGLSVATLEPWFDVDHPGDLDRLLQLLRSGTISAPQTARLLAELRGAPGAGGRAEQG